MTKFRDDIDPAYHPSFFATVGDKYKGDFNRLRIRCTPRASWCRPLRRFGQSQKVMDKDLAIVGQSAIQTYFAGQANPAEDKFNRGTACSWACVWTRTKRRARRQLHDAHDLGSWPPTKQLTP